MNLTKKQRFEIIPKLTEKVIELGETDGFFFLEEYKKEGDSLYVEDEDYGEPAHIAFSYSSILRFIQNLDNATVYEMYKCLFPEDAKKKFPEKKPLYHLSTDKLVLFFSHSHRDLKLIYEVKKVLEKTDWIECFVAHKDIKLGKEWEQKIKKYLECCHCLIAFLSENFKSSDYCDQELGVAIHRDIPILSFTLDKTGVYGFIKHLQAKPFRNPEDLANQIEEYIFDKQESLYQVAQPKFQKAVETLKNNFLNSTNVKMAESVLDQLIEFKTGQIEDHFINEIQRNWKENNKIEEVTDIEGKMKTFFQKHSQKVSTKNEETFHQETPLERVEQSNTEINLRKMLEQNKEPDIPF